MIAITQEGKSTYLIQLKEPEKSWLTELARGLGMDRRTMLGACFTKGTEYYFDMIREIEAHDKRKPTSDAKEHKTYGKGPCQG